MSSLKKEMGSLFPGKVQSLLNERCTKSGSQCTEDSNYEHPKPRAQEPLPGGGGGVGQCHGDGCGGEEPTDTGGVVLMQFEHFLAVTLGK